MRPTLLIVDDHAGFRTSARRLLEAEGFAVVGEAADGAEALAAVDRLAPDLVLLDLHLPDLGGDEVLRRLLADPVTAGVPVVVFSADATRRQAEELLGAGARAYITKPISVGQLLATVDAFLVPTSEAVAPS
jgi:CheY-like chemotaxis protein